MFIRWKTAWWIVGGASLLAVAGLLIASALISRKARGWAEDWLTQEYKSQVQLSSFRVAIPFPLVQAEGQNLVLHFEGRQDLPPLIAIKRFSFRTSIWGLLQNTRHIDSVSLDGLQITIPPREERGNQGSGKNAARKFRMIRFGEIHSQNAILKILTAKPGKEPLEFDIRQLRLSSTGNQDALAFHATLSNPKPPGEIVSSGTFGPWNADTPSLSPVSGEYTFAKADLGVFRGIAGILSSKGKYQGVLEEIGVDGTTDTPDFRVTRADHPLDLTTVFHATVAGTDGDTYLHSVEGHLGKTTLLISGKIEGTKGQKGKTITLDVHTGPARMEDLLQLAIKEQPTLAGPARLNTNFVLAPGPEEIPDRLKLDGSIEVDAAHFTNSGVQQKFDNFSERSQGKPKETKNPAEATSSDDVPSTIKANFRLDQGVLRLSRVSLEVPGAQVRIAGTFTLEQELLDLYGTLTMQAKLSQVTTGVKSFLLKFADPFFSKDGKGAVLPIKITGSVQHPKYGLDLHHRAEATKATK